jgi:hypothetical protein
MNYKNGLLLTILVCVVVFITTENFFEELNSIVSEINFFILILAFFANYVAATSFIIPYATFLLIKKKKISVNKLRDIYFYVYELLFTDKADKNLSRRIRLKTRIVKIADLTSLNFLWVLIPFTDAQSFFTINAVAILLLTINAILKKGPANKKTFVIIIVSCVFRYLLEFPKTLLTFLVFNTQLSLTTIYAFMLGSSVLYQSKRFPNAGGLLELYSVIFFGLSGQALLGLIIAITLHACALLSSAVPILLLQKSNKKE